MKIVRRRSVGKRTIVVIAVVACLFGLAAAAWHVLEAPSEATIASVTPAKTTSLKTVQAPALKQVQGRLASFMYPSNLTPAISQPTSEPETFTFARAGGSIGSSGQLSITIAAAGGTVTDSSAYRYRQLHPDIYKPKQVTVHGATLPSFTANTTDNGAEQVVFWQHGAASATVAITAQPGADQASNLAILQQVLDSWQWR